MNRFWQRLIFGWSILVLPATAKELLRVAAASNLQVVAAPLRAAFEAEHPTIAVEFSHSASGSLVAQIRQGAPFDVLLSANLLYPSALIESGHAAADSLVTFAHGQLVLWPHPPTADWRSALRDPAVRRLAIAQPDTAPFGIAAREILREAGMWADVEARLVYGENVAQALQFAASGNADYAMVAASLLTGRPHLGAGLLIPITTDTLAHGAVVIRGRAQRPLAEVWVEWLGSATARAILEQHGYHLP